MAENLCGKAFVFTGEMEMQREDAVHQVVMHGGRVTTAVSGKTNYLVCGSDPGPKKLETAKRLKIEILDEKGFLNLMSQFKSDEEVYKTSYDGPCAETGKLTMNQAVVTEKNVSFNEIDEIIKSCDNHGELVKKIAERKKEKKLNEKIVQPTIESEKELICDEIPQQKTDDYFYLWSEKYRPKSTADLVGNSTVINELQKFLKGKDKQKAVLISGSPGLGKTTMAHLVCKEMGYDIIEFNASDVRSKIQIAQKIQDTINFYSVRPTEIRKKVVIMDEIDGMSSDRGGIAELGALIKRSSVKLICICNDRNNPKMRTLANHCLDLRCRKLLASQILPRLKKILALEKKQIKEPLLNEIVTASHGDLRYCLNTLQNLCMRETLSLKAAETFTKKIALRSIFDLVGEMFSRKTIRAKIDVYFEDYNFVPIFVFENYLKTSVNNISNIAAATESLSYGDIIDRKVHGPTQEWGLLPLHSFYSCILPTQGRSLRSRIDFPLILGQRSKANKNNELLSKFAMKVKSKSLINKNAMRLDVFELYIRRYLTDFKNSQFNRCIDFLKLHNITKEEMDEVIEILHSASALLKEINTATKRQFTAASKKTLPKEVKKKQEILNESEDSEIDTDESEM